MKNKFIILFFVCCLIPSISIFPISTDVQPLAFIFGLIIFLIDFRNSNFSLYRFEWIYLVFSVFVFFWMGIDGGFKLTDRIGIISTFFIYSVASRNINVLNKKILITAIFINFFGVIWHYFDPNSFIPFAENFVREIKIKEIGFRGVSGFSPEPGFTSAITLTQLIIGYFLFKIKKISTKELIYFITIPSLIIILLTKSGLGFIYLFITILIYVLVNLKFRGFIFLSIFIFTFLSVVNSSMFSNSRGLGLIKLIINNPQALILDSSISERLIGLNVGYKSLFHYPLGTGGGSYLFTALELNEKYSLDSKFPSARFGVQKISSSYGKYLVEFGFLIFIFHLLLLIAAFRFNPLNIIILIIASLFMLFSFSIAFPPTYILFAIGSYFKKFQLVN